MQDDLVQRVRSMIWCVETGTTTRNEAATAIVALFAQREADAVARERSATGRLQLG